MMKLTRTTKQLPSMTLSVRRMNERTRIRKESKRFNESALLVWRYNLLGIMHQFSYRTYNLRTISLTL